MTRLVVFLIFATGLIAVLSLNHYQSLPVSNDKFVYSSEKEKFSKKTKEIEELNAPKVEVVEEEKEVKKPTLVLDTPELKNGHQVYTKTGKCVTCHGKTGLGKKSQNAPKISGQHDWYLYDQLRNMKSGKRVNKVMNPYLRRLSDQDLKDVSTYLSKLSWTK